MYLNEMNVTTEEYKTKTEKVHTAILPVGSFEQHSAHMCLGTDTLIATYIAEEIAKESNCICLYPIVYGVSEIHKSFSGTMYAQPRHFYEYIKDIIISISDENIHNLLIVNGHGANWFAINKACEETRNLYKNIEVIQWWEILEKPLFTNEESSHAGAQELSVLGFINQKFIRKNKVSNQVTNREIDILECTDISELTKNGVIGVATTYDFIKGQKTFEQVVSIVNKKIISWENDDLNGNTKGKK